MTPYISCENISLERASKPIFVRQSFGVSKGECIGVVGNNGSGKSTLLDILSGTLMCDSGDVVYRNNLHIGYLAQHDAFTDDMLVRACVLGSVADYEWAQDPKKRAIQRALLHDIAWDAPIGTLSGGQRRRCDLARVLMSTWDVLLLDEPTNHLDMHTIYWLSEYVQTQQATSQMSLVVVTHDRWFLDEVAHHIWEVHDGTIDAYDGGFSAYVQQRCEREAMAQASWTKHQNMLRKELNWLAHGAKARTSKPKFRVDAALSLIEKDPPVRDTLTLQAQAQSRLGKVVFTLEHVSKSFGSTLVLRDISWLIGPGERIGILGNNGSGKSTLLSLMCKEDTPTSGIVTVGKSVVLGIVDQRLHYFDDKQTQTCAQVLGLGAQSILLEDKRYTPEQLFLRLGFNHNELASRIQDLSGGQQRKLAILMCLIGKPNVLVLDEPGNDLDCDMLACIEDLLDGWVGTLILVSHDRHLVERVCDDVYALMDGTIRHLPGGVDEFMRLIEPADTSAAQTTKAAQAASIGVTTAATSASKRAAACDDAPAKSAAQLRFERKKRYDKLDRKLPKLQERVDAIKEDMLSCDPTCAEKLARLQSELEAAQQEKQHAEDEWLELACLLDE